MTGEEYLKPIFAINQYIMDKKAKIEKLQSQVYGVKAAKINEVSIKTNVVKSPFEDKLIEMSDLEAEFVHEYAVYLRLEHKAYTEISKTRPENHYKSLKNYYIDSLEKSKHRKPLNFDVAIKSFEDANEDILKQNKTLFDLYVDEMDKLQLETMPPFHK